MNLGKQMIERLRLLATDESVLAGLPQGDSGYKLLMVIDEPARMTLEFFDHDRYSVTMRALEVGSGMPFQGDVRAYLSARAAEIARGLSYLEEPLAVWELDDAEKTAQLRSSPPQREGDEVSYWEVTLGIGSARIMRYRWAPGLIEREAIAYPATFALIGRIADSLAEALQTTE
jgi:hypothetical protein